MSHAKSLQKSIAYHQRGFATDVLQPSRRLLLLQNQYGTSRDGWGTPMRPFWRLRLDDGRLQLHHINTYTADDVHNYKEHPASALLWSAGYAVPLFAATMTDVSRPPLPLTLGAGYCAYRALRSAASHMTYKKCMRLESYGDLSIDDKALILSSGRGMEHVARPELVYPSQGRGSVRWLADYLTRSPKRVVTQEIAQVNGLGKASNIIVDRLVTEHLLAQHMKDAYQAACGRKADPKRIAEWDRIIAATRADPRAAVLYEDPEGSASHYDEATPPLVYCGAAAQSSTAQS